jgi:HAD superfamily hydrolase (TIGR01509 family)
MQIAGMHKTIIFDMDGVIIDSEPLHQIIEKRILSAYGVGISEEEHRDYIGTSSLKMYTELQARFDLPLSGEELRERHHQEYETLLEESEVLPIIVGVNELVRSFYNEGYQLFVASSSPMNHIETIISKFKLDAYFESYISGADLENPKPHPQVFLNTAEKARNNPENCLVIEDSMNGVKAAKAAGMFCVGFRNPNSGDQDLSMADMTIESFENITPSHLLSKFA